MKDVHVDLDTGTLHFNTDAIRWFQAVDRAIQLAQFHARQLTYEWKGVTVTVAPDSNPDRIKARIKRVYLGYVPTMRVGPYLKEQTPEQVANDVRVAAAKVQRQKEEAARLRIESKRKIIHVEAYLASRDAYVIELVDRGAWRTAIAESDFGTLQFAVRWACLMQDALTEGLTLADVWRDYASVAVAYDCDEYAAVCLLVRHWCHGEELRELYNADLDRLGSNQPIPCEG